MGLVYVCNIQVKSPSSKKKIISTALILDHLPHHLQEQWKPKAGQVSYCVQTIESHFIGNYQLQPWASSLPFLRHGATQCLSCGLPPFVSDICICVFLLQVVNTIAGLLCGHLSMLGQDAEREIFSSKIWQTSKSTKSAGEAVSDPRRWRNIDSGLISID